MLLKDKVAVITGGAGINGLGFATARQMAAQGARVVILDLARAEPAAAAARLGAGHIGFAMALLLQQAGDYDTLVVDRDPARLAEVAALGVSTQLATDDASLQAAIDGRFAVLNFPGAASVADLPLVGWLYGHLLGGHTALVYLAFLLIPLVHWIIQHTRFGLRLRAVGENAHAADTAGVSVHGVRYAALLCGGLLCAFSGTYLAIVQSGFFLRDMSAGNGFLALAALVFGSWRPVHTAL
eukprot:gene29318-51290_t